MKRGRNDNIIVDCAVVKTLISGAKDLIEQYTTDLLHTDSIAKTTMYWHQLNDAIQAKQSLELEYLELQKKIKLADDDESVDE